MKVSLVMGSISDKEIVEEAGKVLEKFGVSYEVKILSCHRSPNLLRKYVKRAEKKGVKIFIAFAGKSAGLPGIIATLTDLPVIGVPLKSDFLDGLDSLLSISQLPKNIGLACVGIGKPGAINASLFALKMLALDDKNLTEKLKRFRESQEEEIAKLNRGKL